MASGSSFSQANNPGSRAGFDFGSDDILCSYDDFDNRHESLSGSRSGRSDPAIGAGSSKDFHTTRVSRSSAFPTANVYAQPEDSLNQEVITTVQRTIKRHEDNLMRFLEGISSRLSQLELYCYNLDKSIREMRSDLVQHNGEADTKFNSIDKHLQEVHRCVQLLKDKQELFETQKEIAKLQLAQKESSSHSQEDKKSSTPFTEIKNTENDPEMHNQKLALARPPAPPSRITENYLPATQLPNPVTQSQPQPPQSSYIPADSQYQTPQSPNPFPGLFNQSPQVQQLPQYQQQWSPQTVPQAPVQQTHIQPPPQSSLYNPPYMQSQPPLQEQMASSMPMPYMMYDAEGGRSHQPPQAHFSQGGYPPANHSFPLQNPHQQQQPTSAGVMNRGPNLGLPQFVQNHQYNDLIEKVASMGYRGDHVVSVIHRLEESGQPVDFNAVLDRLNGHSSGGSQRLW